MGFFDEVNGPNSAPVIKIAENEVTRLRVIPAPENTKYATARKFWQHYPPREQEQLFGGYCSVLCTGDRNGCIFHNDPYAWKSTSKIPINVIEYEMDKSQRLTGTRTVKIWAIGSRLLEQIKSALKLCQLQEDMISTVDLLVSRTGRLQNTAYAIQVAPNVVEAQIDWNLPTIANGFGDDMYPFLIDYNKMYGFQEMTPDEQQKWLADRIERGRQKMQNGGESSAPASFSFTPPPNAGTAGGFALGAIPTFGSAIGDTMPKASAPNYAAIEAKPDPWGLGKTFGSLTPSELQYIVDTPGHAAEHVTDAKALLTKPAAPVAPPPPPPAAAAPAPPPAPPAPPAAMPAAPAMPTFPTTTAAIPAAPVGVGGAGPAMPTLPTPPAAAAPVAPPTPPVNPKRTQVETLLQTNTAVFADFTNVRRFLGAWGLTQMRDATDEQLESMLQALALPADQLLGWVSQFPVPA